MQTDSDLEIFLKELFGNSKNDSNVNKRDVFLDAVISTEEKEIFEEEYVTPHKDIYSGVNPIKMLKIKEGIKLEFRFLIRDFEICGLTQENRLELYRAILQELGVGAKTNVGYGFLDEVKGESLSCKIKCHSVAKEKEP